MKKLLFLLGLLFASPLFAADPNEMTDKDRIEVEHFFENEVDPNDSEGHTWLRKLSNRRPCKRAKLRKFRELMRQARNNEIGIGRGRKLKMARIRNMTRLNRRWTAQNIKECARGLRCPLDLTLYASQSGVSND